MHKQSHEHEEVECGTVNLSRYQSVPDLIFWSCQQPPVSAPTQPYDAMRSIEDTRYDREGLPRDSLMLNMWLERDG